MKYVPIASIASGTISRPGARVPDHHQSGLTVRAGGTERKMRTIPPPEAHHGLLLLRSQPVCLTSIRHAQSRILDLSSLYLIGQDGCMHLVDQGKLLHTNGPWRWLNPPVSSTIRRAFRMWEKRCHGSISGSIGKSMFRVKDLQ